MLNGKFRCIKGNFDDFMTEDKIYEFVDGFFICENGTLSPKYESIDDFNNRCITQIEPVEENTFTKYDLKTGMWVELANGEKFMVLLNTPHGDILIGEKRMGLNEFTKDLRPKLLQYRGILDMVKVYTFLEQDYTLVEDISFSKINSKDYIAYVTLCNRLELIWEIKDEKTPQKVEKEKIENEMRELSKKQEELAQRLEKLEVN